MARDLSVGKKKAEEGRKEEEEERIPVLQPSVRCDCAQLRISLVANRSCPTVPCLTSSRISFSMLLWQHTCILERCVCVLLLCECAARDGLHEGVPRCYRPSPCNLLKLPGRNGQEERREGSVRVSDARCNSGTECNDNLALVTAALASSRAERHERIAGHGSPHAPAAAVCRRERTTSAAVVRLASSPVMVQVIRGTGTAE